MFPLRSWISAAMSALSVNTGAWTNEWRRIADDARNLLTSREWSEAGFGMRVEAAVDQGDAITVRTTGAVFRFDRKTRTVEVRQRLPRDRDIAALHFSGGSDWRRLAISGRSPGAVWLTAGNGDVHVRINGDSLLMFADKEPVTLTTRPAFSPVNFTSMADRFLLLDNFGGLGLYPLTVRTFDIGPEIEMVTPITRLDKCTVSPAGNIIHRLAAREVFWISVAPPKPYDWSKRPSDHRNIAFFSWYRGQAPTNTQIRKWAGFADTLVIQSPDGSLYQPPGRRRPPGTGAMTDTLMPYDAAEFARVVETAHTHGMQVAVNAGAMYFRAALRQANPERGASRFVRGMSARNFPELLAAVRRVRNRFGIDGVYLDELYPANTVRAYLAVRYLRKLFGDSGVLIEHHDTNFHSVTCPPATLCRYNAQLAGEAMARYYNDRDWLRYAGSTMNIANCNDYLCNNFRCYFRLTGGKYHLDNALIEKCLDYNVYQFYAAWWEVLPAYRDYFTRYFQPFWEQYLARIQALDTETQRKRVARTCARQNARPRVRWRRFLAGLSPGAASAARPLGPAIDRSHGAPAGVGPPGKGTRLTLGNGWTLYFSPHSGGRLETRNGVIEIVARANTCAYLEHALPAEATAVECRIRTDPGNGMTYGPRIGLRWTRADPHDLIYGYSPYFGMILTERETLAVSHQRASTAHILGFPLGKWHTFRYRFFNGYVIGEVRIPTGAWRPVDIMLAPGRPLSLVVGKTGAMNQDVEMGGGKPARFWIESVRVIGPK